jgi:hypothetical protein
MSVTGTAVATKIIGDVFKELLSAGLEVSKTSLTKWKNAATQRQLIRKLTSVELVKTFWQRDKSVRLSSFYFPNRIVIGNSRPTSADSLASLPRDGNYVIQGTIGQGKSIFLRHLCAQELTPRGTKRIPLLIELRAVTSSGFDA